MGTATCPWPSILGCSTFKPRCGSTPATDTSRGLLNLRSPALLRQANIKSHVRLPDIPASAPERSGTSLDVRDPQPKNPPEVEGFFFSVERLECKSGGSTACAPNRRIL